MLQVHNARRLHHLARFHLIMVGFLKCRQLLQITTVE